MNDNLLPSLVSDWLKDTDVPPPDPQGSRSRATAHARETRQARTWLPGVTSWLVDRRLLAGSGAIVAVLVVIVSLALLLPWAPIDDQAGGLADASARPALTSGPIHWQTDVVDLRADGFRLDVSDLAFTADAMPLLVGSDPGEETYWTLEVEWREHGVEQRMNWYFAADEEHWWVAEMRSYDGRSPGEWVYAYGPFFRTPLGESFEGDVRQRLIGEGRPGDPNDLVQAELVLEGLRLSVSPGERGTRTGEPPPGAQDLIADVLRSTRNALFPRPERTPQPTEPPAPRWATDFGDLTLTGELVDEGVLRVTGDGAGNKLSPIVAVDIAEDGTVWLARHKAIFALGEPGELRIEDGGPKRKIERIEANDDGSLTVQADGIWRLDGGAWSLLEPPASERDYLGAGPDGRETVRLEDGTTWRMPAWHPDEGPDALDLRLGDEWVTYEPEDVFPVTRAQHRDEWFVAQALLSAPSGDVWTYNQHALSRFDGDVWRETTADELADIAGGPVNVREAVVGPDGTLWVLVTGQDRDTNPDAIQRLLRLTDGTWAATALEGEIPANGRSRFFYGLDAADEDGVWLMERDDSSDFYVGPDGLIRVSRWTPRDAVEAADGSVFGTARPRSEGLVMVPAGEITPLEPEGA